MAPGLVKYFKYWLHILKHAAQIWSESNAFSNAGSLAFFTLFSIAPVMIVIVSVIGVFYGQQAAEGQIALQLQETIGAQAAEAVQQAVSSSSLKQGGLFATVAGILAMLVGATTVFGQMQNSLNKSGPSRQNPRVTASRCSSVNALLLSRSCWQLVL